MNTEARLKPLGIALLGQLFLYCVQSLVLSFISACIAECVHYGFIFKLASVVTTICVFLLPTILYCRLCGIKPSDLSRCGEGKGSDKLSNAEGFRFPVLTGFIFAACIVLNAANLAGMLTNSVAKSLGFTVSSSSLPSDLATLTLYFISSTVIAPFFEELLFRGVTLDAAAKRGHWNAIFLSALLFGLMHYSLYSFFYAFTAGLIIAYFAKKHGSLWFAIGLHFINNLLTFISIYLSSRSSDAYNLLSDATLAITLPIAVIGAFFEIREIILNRKRFKCSEYAPSSNEKNEVRRLPSELILYIVFSAVFTILLNIF